MAKDLTRGKVTPLLIGFTLPIVLGNLFQLTYNAADSAIVGHFVGKDALAAVGICNPVVTMMILFLNGLCMGASILMGTQYGAKDYDTLHRQISTTMLGGVVFSSVLSVLCILFARPILVFMQTDPEILDMTTEYLRIIFVGLLFTFLYNFFSSTLRALGDSRTPLLFLIISAALNVFGDLFFVIVLNMGTKGCAIATVISEAICCLCCIIYIRFAVPILRLGKKWLVFDRQLLKKTVAYGWVSAMQQATVQLGKIGMQTIVNTMGVSVSAAFSAVNRIDDYAYTPEQNIGHAMMSLMAQNRGAGKKERMREGFRAGMLIEIGYGIAIFLLFYIFATPLMTLFVDATREDSAEVIAHGVKYLRLISFMYILPAITNGIQGYFRGIGDLKVTLISSFINVIIRIVAALPLVFLLNMSIEALPLSYLCGWIGMLVAETPLLLRSYKKLRAEPDSDVQKRD